MELNCFKEIVGAMACTYIAHHQYTHPVEGFRSKMIQKETVHDAK